MYRWLLCWRYLRTRYIALASVISVMLGVATLIVVNSVMDGFTTEMQDRMHGILSDVVVESQNTNGIGNHYAIQQEIRQTVGDDLVGLTAVVHVPAMVSIDHRGETRTQQINLIGIDTDTYSKVSDFSKFLMHPDNRKQLDFVLRESGYGVDRPDFPKSGWEYRRSMAARKKQLAALTQQIESEKKRNEELRSMLDEVAVVDGRPSRVPPADLDGLSNSTSSTVGTDQEPVSGEDSSLLASTIEFPEIPAGLSPSAETAEPLAVETSSSGAPALAPQFDAVVSTGGGEARKFDPEVDQHEGIVLGISIGSTRYRNAGGEVTDYYFAQPGDDVQVTFPSAGSTPRAINSRFTVVDFYESKMSEYDATFAFVPLETLQRHRGMQGAISSIQLKLRDGADLNLVRDKLRAKFPIQLGIQVNTWRDLQGALLAAVEMETTILNILLFLIIAVAGFGILATFFMIVVEKTKDIGVLKSLGASGSGIATIFLGYGVLLGAFGAGVGAVAGLVFVAYINNIADVLERITGREVFDPTVYYFDTIPTIVHPAMVVWVVIGAVLIAVMASVLPSIRAARMHPVEALRYE
ncbi:ABC transporter permease [Aureliella helgolandensis]|uniref:Lipoprotein-releasing system transmembrane protein LolE n=1 Tax=Aureliella helgolandensis TaxID=2527968 RepID=A0A518GAN0_9BACT|nr:FtsX-like permease family protein [Aureliella helgolandensis]QDV25652.1 Lipoprotein-releasing system transmembrane protein LolE [Aureliella helgolandensis]